MSIFSDIGNFVSKTVSSAVNFAGPALLASVFPPAALIPGLSNLVTSTLGGALSDVIGQLGKQGGIPKFVMNTAQDLLKQVVSQLLKPVDQHCAEHVNDKCGDTIKSLIDELMHDFKNAFQNYQNEQAKNGKGCGKGGSAGPIGFRELAAILAELEQKQAKNVQAAVQKASDALGVDKKADGAEQSQFKAMEESKAEAQIFQALSSAISEVMKNFGGALQTAARGG